MEFTFSAYEAVIKKASQNYKFSNALNDIISESNVSICRHDLDMSVHRGLIMADIEARYGVKSVYFVQLNSCFYNPFEKEIREILLKIKSLGHSIGLHLDSEENPTYQNDILAAEQKALLERDILEKIISDRVEIISFHNPSLFNFKINEKEYFGGMLNFYSRSLQSKFEYCSDSNGIWRYNKLNEFLDSNIGKSVQILTHPEWWAETVLSPYEKLLRLVDGRRNKNLKDYLSFLERCGRPIVK